MNYSEFINNFSVLKKFFENQDFNPFIFIWWGLLFYRNEFIFYNINLLILCIINLIKNFLLEWKVSGNWI